MSFLHTRTQDAAQGFGKSVLRREDPRLLRGEGTFSDDFNLPRQAHAIVLRSPHAHAWIRGMTVDEARRSPGVLAVLTGADMQADGLQPIPHRPVPAHPHEIPLKNRDGSTIFVAPHWPLAIGKVRTAGEAVAMVVAETIQTAKDAAEKIVIDYEPLPATTESREATKAGVAPLWDQAPSNICVETGGIGDLAKTSAAFAAAKHIVAVDTWVNRATGVPLEPRAALAVFDGTTYTVYAGGGSNIRIRTDLSGVLGVPETAIRVIAKDVGGNYGTRNNTYPEFALVAWAAKRIKRPVKWVCERSESFLTEYHGRDLVSTVELALDESGRFIGFRGTNTSNVGAFGVSFVPLAKGSEMSSSVYNIAAAHLVSRAVHTNTSPTTPYRSAGRPEVMYVIERLIDMAAQRHGFDRVAIRRLNLVTAMPYRNPYGMLYDSGDYASVQAKAVELSDWSGFDARRAEARSRGMLRGIGLANYIEVATGFPRERATITVHADQRVDVALGTLSAGQGHETSFAQMMAEWLGVEVNQVNLITGDTDAAPIGGGSHSGRSMRMGGIVMAVAADQIVEKGKRIAARLLEAAEGDIEFARRRFSVKGTDRGVDLFEVARAATRSDMPDDLRGPLAAVHEENLPQPSFPHGSHVCEVEIDPETGVVDLVRYTAVDDVGRAINPMIVHGQTQGGIAQGVGQALWERCHYDAATGQLLAGSFFDYTMPRADMLPFFTTAVSEVPSTTNALGLRGGGEGGTTGALGAVVNSVVDALAEFGVEHMDMPVTPERVWQAIRGRAKA
ncbi:MAG: xanthine dehydrogenase family protein molybdopterin-binding subunit [Betaproteobacteria bacterium]|nr:xanthine dehydrogenase family protein molybdopterin-binding subunit [Betaproteobacteria bacterium]